LIKQEVRIYKFGLGQSPFPVPDISCLFLSSIAQFIVKYPWDSWLSDNYTW